MEIDYKWWGLELYTVDGTLLDKRWSISLSGDRQFTIGSHSIRIELSVRPNQYFTRVFVDNELHIPELFPRVKARIEALEKWQKPPYSYIAAALSIVGGLVLGLWAIVHFA